MAIYLVDISTKHPDHDYGPLWRIMDELKAKRALDTTWFLETFSTIQDITTRVAVCLDPADHFFIVEIAERAKWAAVRLDHEASLWLKIRRP